MQLLLLLFLSVFLESVFCLFYCFCWRNESQRSTPPWRGHKLRGQLCGASVSQAYSKVASQTYAGRWPSWLWLTFVLPSWVIVGVLNHDDVKYYGYRWRTQSWRRRVLWKTTGLFLNLNFLFSSLQLVFGVQNKLQDSAVAIPRHGGSPWS